MFQVDDQAGIMLKDHQPHGEIKYKIVNVAYLSYIINYFIEINTAGFMFQTIGRTNIIRSDNFQFGQQNFSLKPSPPAMAILGGTTLSTHH